MNAAAALLSEISGRPMALRADKLAQVAEVLGRRAAGERRSILARLAGVEDARARGLAWTDADAGRRRSALLSLSSRACASARRVYVDDRAEAVARDDDGPMASYDLLDGVAVLDVYGGLVKRPMTFLPDSLRLLSTIEIRAAVAHALDSPEVRVVALMIDCPGGTVDGTYELGSWLREQRGRKPMIAIVDGQAASGGYMIAAACDEIWAAAEADVGSIGVRMVVVDVSEANRRRGVAYHLIESDPLKGAGGETAPPTDEQMAHLRATIEDSAARFRAFVAEARGVDAETIRALGGGVYPAGYSTAAFLTDTLGRTDQALAHALALAGAPPAVLSPAPGDPPMAAPARPAPPASARLSSARLRPTRTAAEEDPPPAAPAPEEPSMIEDDPTPENLAALREAYPNLIAAIEEDAMQRQRDAEEEGATGRTPEEAPAAYAPRGPRLASAPAAPAATQAELEAMVDPSSPADARFVLDQLRASASVASAARAYAAHVRGGATAGAVARRGVAPAASAPGRAPSAATSGPTSSAADIRAAWDSDPTISGYRAFGGDVAKWERFARTMLAQGVDPVSEVRRAADEIAAC